MRQYFEPLKRWLGDPRLLRSPLVFAAAVLLALVTLWVREPTLFTEPTIGQDDVLCFAAHYGDGPVLFHHSGAVHVLPMFSSWVFTRSLPESFIPYAYSFTTLLLAAVAPATLLLPALERWLPLIPQRAFAFALLIALPLDTAFLVASMSYQHLHYLLITFIMLAFSSAPSSASWFESASRLKLTAFCALFAAVATSAPLCIVLTPLPLYTLLGGESGRRPSRQQMFALFAAFCLLSFALFGISTDHAFVVRANLAQAMELGKHLGILLFERVSFETFFGFSSRLWLSNRLGAPWAVTLLGLVLAAMVVAIFVKRRRQVGAEIHGAGFALYAVVALPAFAVFGRWHLQDAEAWHSASFRYFVPAAKLLVLALTILVAKDWDSFRHSRLLVGSTITWIALLNFAENPRYAGALAPALTASSQATSLRAIGREERRALSRLTVRQFAAIEHLARALAPGEARPHTFPEWDVAVMVRGRGSD